MATAVLNLIFTPVFLHPIHQFILNIKCLLDLFELIKQLTHPVNPSNMIATLKAQRLEGFTTFRCCLTVCKGDDFTVQTHEEYLAKAFNTNYARSC